jgi:squalene synthase HpnC
MVWDFARELEKWGPANGGRKPPVSLTQARAYCAHVSKTHYENFTVVSLLLPRRLIRHFHAVYAYCRWSDDLADETAGGFRRGDGGEPAGGSPQIMTALDLIAWWRQELLACYAESVAGVDSLTPHPPQTESAATSPSRGEVKTLPLTSPLEGEVAPRSGAGGGCARGNPNCAEPHHPVMIALRETIRRFNIPPEPFLDLLVAFEQDQRVKRYDTFDQLLGYCRNSANPVGQLVLMLFECFDAERMRLSNEVCTGLQLANFWQDVARDFAIGRVYLPAEDRARFGYSDDDFAAKRCTPQFRALMQFEVDRARGFFDRGEKLLPLLPRAARIDVDLFIRGGRAILHAIERIDYDVWAKRPEVSKWAKGKLLLGAVARSVL